MLETDLVAGNWVKFDRYQVHDGYISPAPGAEGSWYDPWAEFRSERSRQRNVDRPYQSLLQLVESLPYAATVKRDENLCEWCAQHGLLGVLLAQSDMATLAPVPDETGRLSQKRHFRMNDRWGSFTRSEDEAADAGWLPTGALIQRLGQTKWLPEPMPQTWGRYFPGVPEPERESFQYPRPYTDQFWRRYAEPVSEFLSAGELFRQTIDGLRDAKPEKDRQDEDFHRIESGIHLLRSLVFRVSPTITLETDGSYRVRWIATSLLGSFAMMALLDLTESRSVLHCKVCGKPFVSGSPKAKYCNPKCRHAAQKRRQRAKTKETPNG